MPRRLSLSIFIQIYFKCQPPRYANTRSSSSTIRRSCGVSLTKYCIIFGCSRTIQNIYSLLFLYTFFMLFLNKINRGDVMKTKYGYGYVRVSSDKQEELSPDSQSKLLKDFAHKNGIILLNIFFGNQGFLAEKPKSVQSSKR